MAQPKAKTLKLSGKNRVIPIQREEEPEDVQEPESEGEVLGTIEFTEERITKNAIRYSEDVDESQPHSVGTIYLQKWFAQGASRIRITIEKID